LDGKDKEFIENLCEELSQEFSMCKTSNIKVARKDIGCEDGTWNQLRIVPNGRFWTTVVHPSYSVATVLSLPVQCDISPVYFLPIVQFITPCNFGSMLFIMCNKKKTVVSSINALKITRYI
jgi:hypothetical protein